MTRDEAMERLMAETQNSCTECSMKDFLDMAIALGMLKLEEQKHPIDVLASVSGGGAITPRQAIQALSNAGFRIIPK